MGSFQHHCSNGAVPSNILPKSVIKRKRIEHERQHLPIFRARQKLLQEIRKRQAIVVVGETGSGKTTQIPQYLSEQGIYTDSGGAIAVTQPRRVAAVTVAARVALEQNAKLGDFVGYSIRFDDKTSINTVIKYLTDGMLLREAMLDPTLEKYSVVIVDEAHERTVQTDILFGLLRSILTRRKDLKVIIMSATLQADHFANFFGYILCLPFYSLMSTPLSPQNSQRISTLKSECSVVPIYFICYRSGKVFVVYHN